MSLIILKKYIWRAVSDSMGILDLKRQLLIDVNTPLMVGFKKVKKSNLRSKHFRILRP